MEDLVNIESPPLLLPHMNEIQMEGHYPYAETIPIGISSKTTGSLPEISFLYSTNQGDINLLSPPSLSPHLNNDEDYQNVDILASNNDSLHQQNLAFYSVAENPISNDKFSIETDNCPVPSICCRNPAFLPLALNLPLHPVICKEREMDSSSIPPRATYYKVDDYSDVTTNSDEELIVIDLTKCAICKKNKAVLDFNFPTADSVKYIVSHIKSVLGELYGSLKEQINSIEYKFQDKFHLERFLAIFSNPPQNKAGQKIEIIHKRICSVPRTYTKRTKKKKIKKKNLLSARPFQNRVGIIVRRVAQEKSLTNSKQYDEATPFESKRVGIIVTRVVQEETFPNPKEDDEALNKKTISYFFPKLMTKITKISLLSKFERAVKKTLKSKKSLFILSCKSRLAWKFGNIDASALFKLSAVEIERGNINQAFIYYKQAGISMSNMIFRDKIFSFLSEGKRKLTSVKELPHSDTYFFYRQVNIALMDDDSTFSFTFDDTDCTKLNETEIDGAKAIKSIDYFSVDDLYNIAARFNSDG